MAFSRELILLSAVLLPLVAASLTTAFVRLAPYRGRGALAVLSPEYWLLHFPVGLHAGWTTAGEQSACLPACLSVCLSHRWALTRGGVALSDWEGGRGEGVVLEHPG